MGGQLETGLKKAIRKVSVPAEKGPSAENQV